MYRVRSINYKLKHIFKIYSASSTDIIAKIVKPSKNKQYLRKYHNGFSFLFRDEFEAYTNLGTAIMDLTRDTVIDIKNNSRLTQEKFNSLRIINEETVKPTNPCCTLHRKRQ